MRQGSGRIAGALLLSVAIATGFVMMVEWARHHTYLTWHPADLSVYRKAARMVLGGGSPYEFAINGYAFVYPPFAALVFAPLGWFGRAAGYWCWTLGSLVSLQAVIWLLLGRSGVTDRRRRSGLLLAGTMVLLPLSPVAGTLLLGNVNTLLMALVLVDLLRVSGRYQGVLIGIAAGIKLTPLIFVPYLLLTGRVRAGLTALLSFAGTVGAGALLLPGPSLAFWGGLFDSSRTRPPGEEAVGGSIRGAVLSLLPDAVAPVWLPVALAVGGAGIALAVRADRRGEELLGIVVVAVTGLLVSPVTWYTHWVWCVPVLALAALRLDRGRWPGRTVLAGLWLVFTIPLPWWAAAYVVTGRAFSERSWVVPTELLHFFIGASLFVTAAIWLRRAGTPQPRPVPAKGLT